MLWAGKHYIGLNYSQASLPTYTTSKRGLTDSLRILKRHFLVGILLRVSSPTWNSVSHWMLPRGAILNIQPADNPFSYREAQTAASGGSIARHGDTESPSIRTVLGQKL